MNMNMEFFRLINNLTDKNIYLDGVMVFISKFVPYIFMVVVAAVFILGLVKKKTEYKSGAAMFVL